jgi:transposase
VKARQDEITLRKDFGSPRGLVSYCNTYPCHLDTVEVWGSRRYVTSSGCMLPWGLGYVEGITHNYVRHGTTTLFAAFDPITGTVLSQCKRRHRHQEFLDFLRHVDTSVPKALDVHLIVDNYATHKHPRVQRWLAARPRYHVHFTPTYSSWLNQVEIWFNIITQKAIRRAPSAASKNLLPKSNLSSVATMWWPDPSPGRPRPIQFWKKSSDYVNVFPGHNTSKSLL